MSSKNFFKLTVNELWRGRKGRKGEDKEEGRVRKERKGGEEG